MWYVVILVVVVICFVYLVDYVACLLINIWDMLCRNYDLIEMIVFLGIYFGVELVYIFVVERIEIYVIVENVGVFLELEYFEYEVHFYVLVVFVLVVWMLEILEI